MNEEIGVVEAEDYFNQELPMEEQPKGITVDAEAIPQFEGICPKCFGSKFLMTERNGFMGVLYTSENNDSEGKPIKRLMSCDCTIKTTY